MNDSKVTKETTDWLLINKASGWHSFRGKDKENPNLQDWLEELYPELGKIPDSGLCHRLDRWTSGALLVGRNLDTHNTISDLIRGRGIHKIYLAWVEGRIEDGEFKLYFANRYRRSRVMKPSATGEEKQMGQCRWRTLQYSTARSLIEVQLIGPGKRHQIRSGLKYFGHPICGDKLYGASDSSFFGLHAWKLKWDDLELICPIPPHWPPETRS